MSIFDDASSIMNAALHAALPGTAEGILYVFLVFQTEEVGQKDGCGSQTQLRGVALKSFLKILIGVQYNW